MGMATVNYQLICSMHMYYVLWVGGNLAGFKNGFNVIATHFLRGVVDDTRGKEARGLSSSLY